MSGPKRELVPVRTLGGVAPMEFQFGFISGYMAFTDGVSTANRRLLLVTDNGQAAVHVVDVVHGTHVGYVAAPGTILHCRGVATRKSLAAVSCERRTAEVRVFENSDECKWTVVRVIAAAGLVTTPFGLRFTADGTRLVVADSVNQRLSMFCAKDGAFLRHIALVAEGYFVYPRDVEECVIEGGRAGWVTCHLRGLVAIADNEADADTVARRGFGLPNDNFALATVPSLGLLVTRHLTGVQFFATPDAVSMASMSFCKVAWMAAACRGLFFLRAAILKGFDCATHTTRNGYFEARAPARPHFPGLLQA